MISGCFICRLKSAGVQRTSSIGLVSTSAIDFLKLSQHPRQPTSPMSTAISCTRAVVPRVTSRATRCRRFASTEAVSTGTATPPIISTQRAKKITEPLNVKMHRMLYPEHYERADERNWKPKQGVATVRTRRPATKRIDDKWSTAMRQQGVQKHLSTSTPIKSVFKLPQNSNRF